MLIYTVTGLDEVSTGTPAVIWKLCSLFVCMPVYMTRA